MRPGALLIVVLLSGCQFSKDLATWCTGTGRCTANGTPLPYHSLTLDGTAYVKAPDTDDTLDLTGDWTAEIWIKDESTVPDYKDPSRRYLYAKGDNLAGTRPYFAFSQYAYLYAGSRDTSQIPVTVFMPDFIQLQDWHHVATTFQQDSGVVTLYLDGVPVGAGSSTPAPSTGPLFFGNSESEPNTWVGKLDDFRLWNVVRTQAEIAATMHGELIGPQPGLVANWKFDEPQGQQAVDSVGGRVAQIIGDGGFSVDVPPGQ